MTVSNATLHNEDLIEQKDIRIGDWVEVMRAGEVIPQIIGPLRERRDGSEKPFQMPDKCPACGTPVERPPDEAMRYCPNATCPGRVLEGIVHFASRDAMDIRGLGYERVRQLLDARLIHDVADLYQLNAEELVELDRFAKQSANQLVAAIAASNDRPLSIVLFGIGIRHVGKNVAQLLARRFGSMEALMERLGGPGQQQSPESGPTIAEAVVSFFAEPRNRSLIERLRRGGAPDGRGRRRRNGRPAERQVLRTDRDLAHPEPPEGREPDRTGWGARHRQRQQEDRCPRGGRGGGEQAGEGHGAWESR